MQNLSKKRTCIYLLLPSLVGALSALLTRSGMERFEGLRQPPWAPPRWAFPAVWITLYILMGISAVLIARSSRPGVRDALKLFYAQLFVNFWWSILFFTWELRLFAFFWLVLLFVLAAAMVFAFRTIDHRAALMNIPYLLWLILAGCLNLSVWRLNK